MLMSHIAVAVDSLHRMDSNRWSPLDLDCGSDRPNVGGAVRHSPPPPLLLLLLLLRYIFHYCPYTLALSLNFFLAMKA